MTAVERIRRYAPDISVALSVLAMGVLEGVLRRQGAPTLLEVLLSTGLISGHLGYYGTAAVSGGGGLSGGLTAMVTVAGVALACGLVRRHGGAALLTVAVTALIYLLLGGEIMLAHLAVVYVAFALACWGSREVIWASLIAIPIGSAAVTHHLFDRLGFLPAGLGSWPEMLPRYLVGTSIMALILGVPWLIGLALRTSRSAKVSQEARVEAEGAAARSEEVAALRAEQARLARDVHDVVGHSLTVILAQAESAKYLDLADQEKVGETFDNIAATARRSLSDVRSVLVSTGDEASDVAPGSNDLSELVAGVRAAGNHVDESVQGTPRPLPPEIHVVAYRTLQEMLTNALKHGTRGTSVRVEQRWEDELFLAVTNRIDSVSVTSNDGHGMGQVGMARRLESIGGQMRVSQVTKGGEEFYVAEARLPVRPVNQ